MPREYNSMPADVLLMMAASGGQDAKEERLIREVMAVDAIEWKEANAVLDRMKTENRKGLFLTTLPYKLGVAAAVSAGLVSSHLYLFLLS
jgi:hypothetical protein